MNKWKIATFALATLIMSMFTLGIVSSQPAIGQPERYVDSEAIIDLSLLPGVRINLNFNQDIDVYEDETMHVQHGFVSNSPWDEMSAAEQTEFLSTTKFRFFYQNEEIPLNHIIRYDTQDLHMYSMFYRVFPPGFFPVGQNQIHGEWTWLESGSWIFYEDTGTVKVTKTAIEDVYEPNNDPLNATNLGNYYGVTHDLSNITSNISPSTDVDWYCFWAVDTTTGGTDFGVVIQFIDNPEGKFWFEVYRNYHQGPTPGNPQNRWSGSEYVGEGTYFADNGSPFLMDDSAWYWVKVYQASGDILYEDYVLEISNGYHFN